MAAAASKIKAAPSWRSIEKHGRHGSKQHISMAASKMAAASARMALAAATAASRQHQWRIVPGAIGSEQNDGAASNIKGAIWRHHSMAAWHHIWQHQSGQARQHRNA